MKLLLLYKTSAESPTYKTPSSFAVQGDVLAAGLKTMKNIDCRVVDRRNEHTKHQAYIEFKPDFVIGIGYWGDVPEIVSHPLKFGQRPIPWLVSDGAVLDYIAELNQLPLVLTTSQYVAQTFARDGVHQSKLQTVYEGIETDVFSPQDKEERAITQIRRNFDIFDDEVLLLTVGGDGKSKGLHQTLHALKLLERSFTNWKYLIKVAASEYGRKQTTKDQQVVKSLGFSDKVTFFSSMMSDQEMVTLFNASDIYVSPSLLEGFCRPLVEAQSCAIPVITVCGTATKEVVLDGVSGFAVPIQNEITQSEFFFRGKTIRYENPKVVGVEASIEALASTITKLQNLKMRRHMGAAGRAFVCEQFDYRVCAKRFIYTIQQHYGV